MKALLVLRAILGDLVLALLALIACAVLAAYLRGMMSWWANRRAWARYSRRDAEGGA